MPATSAADILSPMQAIAVTLRHDERLKDTQEVYLQFALLYSTTGGQRRIRCID